MSEKSKKFKYLNLNPQKREVDDCVVRAIALATQTSWYETYIMLSDLAMKDCVLLNDSNFVEKFLDDNFTKEQHMCKKCTIDDISLPNGVFLITIQGHITCIIDNCVYDTWDCRDEIVWGLWRCE